MAYFLAIDAGGTKTDFALCDEGRTLARVRAGSIKRLRVDASVALANLESALRELTAQSGVMLSEVQRTCIGTAGETVPLVTDFLRAEIGARVGGQLLLLGDVEIALDAAFPGEAGILVLAGTGSNVAGRTHAGRVMTSGGWGPVLADQGSGHGIGLAALRALSLAHDEGRPTSLHNAVLQFWGLASFNHLVEHANRTPAPDFSRLTETVLRCADAGDALAGEVLVEQGRQLAYLVRVLIRRLRLRSADNTFTPQLAFAGSVMERVAPVREALVRAVQEEFPLVTAMAGVIDPIDGAVWRARQGEGFAG